MRADEDVFFKYSLIGNMTALQGSPAQTSLLYIQFTENELIQYKTV